MPHPLELPGMRFAVVELVCSHGRAGFGRRVVNELVALALGRAVRRRRFTGRRSRLVPSLAAVVRTLNDLPKPSAGLRSINAIWISRRPLQVIHLPSGEVRPTYVPFFSLAI